MGTSAGIPLIDALRAVSVFQGLTEEQLGWLVSNSQELRFAAGDLVVEAGAPADRMTIVIEGELQGKRQSSDAVFIAGAGTVTGMLPFSRMTHFLSTIRAT